MNKRTTGEPAIHPSLKAAFFVGQAMILLAFPFEVQAALSELPGWVEAQANEALIAGLCATIPFVIVCEIAAWAAFVKRQIAGMLIATVAPLVILIMLVISGSLF